MAGRARVAIYISDHGFGHAARQVGLVRALGARGAFVSVHNHHALSLLRTLPGEFPGQVSVHDCVTDPGFVTVPGRLAVDWAATEPLVREWLAGWDDWVARERAVHGGAPPEVIVADIVPAAHILAEALGVPSVAIANFSWADIYAGAPFAGAVLPPLRTAHGRAASAIALPFTLGLEGLPAAGAPMALFRPVTRTREAVRRALGIATGELAVYFGLGGSVAMNFDAARVAPGVRLILNQGVQLRGAHARIPDDDPEGQDYMAAADLVVTKNGYGTVLESWAARRPVLMMEVEGHPEAPVMAAALRATGAGKIIVPEEIPEILGDARALRARIAPLAAAAARLGPEYTRNQAAGMAERILRMAGAG